MRLTKCKIAAVLLTMTCIVTFGFGIAALSTIASEPEKTAKAPVDEKKSPAADPKGKGAPPSATEGKGEELAKRIRELQKKRIEALKNLVKTTTNLLQSAAQGVSYLDAVNAQLDLSNAELEIADKPSDRVAICEKRVELLKQFEKVAEVKAMNARGTYIPVYKAQAARIQAEIDLERAKAAAANDRK